MRFFSVSLGVILFVSIARADTKDLRQELDAANIVEKFDVARDGVGHLLLPVVIQKNKYLFIIDTGCDDIIYDVSFRSVLGKPKKTVTASTDAGSVKLESFDAPEIFLGKLSLQTTSDVSLFDLSKLRKYSGCDVYGIIGMSFLKHHVLRIDFDKGEVHFLKSPGFKPGKAYCLSFQNGVPSVETIIPGCEGKEKFIIDTGADTNFSGNMRFDLYKLLKKNQIATNLSLSHNTMTLGGAVIEKDFLLNIFSFGPFSHRDLIFSSNQKCDNVLGLGYLSRYIVTFDFPNQTMYLHKGKMFDLSDGTDRSGLSICRRAGKTFVSDVSWLSPAWWSGIRPDDVILKIEENCSNLTSLYSLRRLLCMGGKKVHVVLQRDQKQIEISLLLSGDRGTVTSGKGK